jgi:hypothetical protein
VKSDLRVNEPLDLKPNPTQSQINISPTFKRHFMFALYVNYCNSQYVYKYSSVISLIFFSGQQVFSNIRIISLLLTLWVRK